MEDSESHILFMGTYPPRECGIATFTQDLVRAVDKRLSQEVKTDILAINRNGTNIYNYPKKVIFQLNDSNIDDYITLAKKINSDNRIKLVCIQHEFGIFGGEYGSYLIPFLEILEKPKIITFHSILPSPNEQLRRVVISLASKVNAIIVMNSFGKEILRNDYGIKTDIYIIPHGIPYTPYVASEIEKKKLGYEDKLIISSFGMLNKGKGYEYVIESLPEVVKMFPNLLYIIIGETHPVVRKKEGEEYRNFLESKVKELGLQKHVKFYNKYVTLKEIVLYLRASDVYISSGMDPNQITSGTLSYALGCGRPVISTPFLHAKEVVTPDKGILVEYNNKESFSKAIIYLLSHPDVRKNMSLNAYHQTRKMTWENIAAKYKEIFKKYWALDENIEERLPKIRFKHLIKLTDNFGIVQFSKNTMPDKNSGYSLDDVSRALIVATKHYNLTKDASHIKLIQIYLNFISYIQDADGKFFNLVDKNKNIERESWSEDAHGRTVWALGYFISSQAVPAELKDKAKIMFEKSHGINQCINSPRPICFLIAGYYFYQTIANSEAVKDMISSLGGKLLKLYQEHHTNDWKWFENSLNYDNGKFPESLFLAYLATGNKDFLNVAKESLDFLISICFDKEMFIPIGQKGWYLRDGKRAYFDQQPLEASSMVQALLEAYRIYGDESYLTKAMQAFHWFLGKNINNQSLYNDYTGGCYDGLGEHTININQGAESTVSYLLARLSIEDILNKNAK